MGSGHPVQIHGALSPVAKISFVYFTNLEIILAQ